MVWAVSLSSAELSPDVLTAAIKHMVFVVCEGWVSFRTPVLYRALPPYANCATLALKLFRGEPAISEFDWHFTSNHKSSEHFAAYDGSVLHVMLLTLQPAHG
jgi:hypothetical protein